MVMHTHAHIQFFVVFTSFSFILRGSSGDPESWQETLTALCIHRNLIINFHNKKIISRFLMKIKLKENLF